jgi:hypothetical protein
MSDYDLAVYYQQQAAHLANVTAFLVIVTVVLGVLLIICAGYSIAANQERNRLREKLAQQSDPAYQLALIRDLGEAGRREVRRLADEAQHAMLFAGGRR